MIYVGCQKEEIKSGTVEQNVTTQLRTTVTPTVENGTLKFETFSDVKNFADELKNQSKVSSPEESNIVHQFYSNFIKEYNFISLYSLVEKDEIGLVTNNIIGSTEFYLIFNQYHEVIIGNKLYVQKNRYEYYIIDKNDIKNKTILRQLNLGEDLDVSNYNPGIKITTFDKVVVPRTKECDCSFSLEQTNLVLNLNNEFILKISCTNNIVGSSYTIISSDDVKVPGNDSYGQSWEGTISSVSTNSIKLLIPKTVKLLNLKLCINMDCGDGVKQYCFTIKKDLRTACCKKRIDITETHIIPNSGIKMVNKLFNGVSWTYYYHDSEIQSRSESSGKYLKANLKQWLDVSARNQNLCEIFIRDTDYDECNNCKWNGERIWVDAAQPDTNEGFHKLGDCTFKNSLERAGHLGVHAITPDYCQ